MVQTFREEFRLKCFSLEHENYASFAQSKWMSPIPYMIYRWVVALFFVINFLMERDTFKRWYTGYFTGWGMATICIYTSLYAILSSYHYYRSRKHASIAIPTQNHSNNKEIDLQYNTNNKETVLPCIEYKHELHPGIVWGYKILWMLFNIAAVNSLIVTLGYWSVLHSARSPKYLVGKLGFHNITAHLLNGVVMLVEVFITPFPIRLLHVVYSTLYGMLYICSSIIFWLAIGKIFYGFLDYSRSPGFATITIVVCFFIIQPLFQLLYYGIYRLRERLLAMRSRDLYNDQTDHTNVITEC